MSQTQNPKKSFPKYLYLCIYCGTLTVGKGHCTTNLWILGSSSQNWNKDDGNEMEDLAEKDAYSYSIPVIKQEIILKAEI